jgi:actin-like ATPase involved in cell morphogenesis
VCHRFTCSGLDDVTHLPKTIELTSFQFKNDINSYVEKLVIFLHSFMDEMDPEMYGEIKRNGIQLTGGCAIAPGLFHELRKRIDLPLYFSPHPHVHTVLGATYSTTFLKRYSFS